jgi:hypothetical protein
VPHPEGDGILKPEDCSVKTLVLRLDDAAMAELERVSARQQRDVTTFAEDLVRRYLEAERAKQAMQSSDLVALYGELAGEDVSLAESGLADYSRLLEEADQEGQP